MVEKALSYWLTALQRADKTRGSMVLTEWKTVLFPPALGDKTAYDANRHVLLSQPSHASIVPHPKVFIACASCSHPVSSILPFSFVGAHPFLL